MYIYILFFLNYSLLRLLLVIRVDFGRDEHYLLIIYHFFSQVWLNNYLRAHFDREAWSVFIWYNMCAIVDWYVEVYVYTVRHPSLTGSGGIRKKTMIYFFYIFFGLLNYFWMSNLDLFDDRFDRSAISITVLLTTYRWLLFFFYAVYIEHLGIYYISRLHWTDRETAEQNEFRSLYNSIEKWKYLYSLCSFKAYSDYDTRVTTHPGAQHSPLYSIMWFRSSIWRICDSLSFLNFF